MRRLLVVVVLLLAPPAVARAATVLGSQGNARVTAGSDEVNDVIVTQTPRGLLRLRDRSARLRVRRGCRRMDLHTVRCGPTEAPVVRLGDEDDMLTARLPRGAGLIASGGPGDDVLTGGPEPDQLSGGRGVDRLDVAGNGPADLARCGGGADVVVSTSRDTVAECEVLAPPSGAGLDVAVLPTADADSADFTVACTGPLAPGCLAILRLSGPEGEAYGERAVALAPGRTGATVRVPLTPAGKAAIRAGAVLVVDVDGGGEVYGYRVTLP